MKTKHTRRKSFVSIGLTVATLNVVGCGVAPEKEPETRVITNAKWISYNPPPRELEQKGIECETENTAKKPNGSELASNLMEDDEVPKTKESCGVDGTKDQGTGENPDTKKPEVSVNPPSVAKDRSLK